MTVTFLPKRVRNSASSIAESPPPTTTMCLSRKNAPSQVAHVETPRPRKRASRGMSSQRALAPVATMTRVGGVLVVLGPQPERRCAEIDLGDVDEVQHRAEALGLQAEVLHQFGPHDPLREAGVVLDLGRQHQLAAVQVPGEDDRREVGAGGVDGGGQAGRAGTDDCDGAVGTGHVAPFNPQAVASGSRRAKESRDARRRLLRHPAQGVTRNGLGRRGAGRAQRPGGRRHRRLAEGRRAPRTTRPRARWRSCWASTPASSPTPPPGAGNRTSRCRATCGTIRTTRTPPTATSSSSTTAGRRR